MLAINENRRAQVGGPPRKKGPQTAFNDVPGGNWGDPEFPYISDRLFKPLGPCF
jgi:hypothetical protein